MSISEVGLNPDDDSILAKISGWDLSVQTEFGKSYEILDS